MTPRAAIQIENNRLNFAPGEILRGRAGWQSETPPEKAELRLFYFTKGRGTRDVEILDTQTWDNPGASTLQDFQFTLPQAPYSFSGKLVSLVWALELVFHPGGHTERMEITISPNGQDIDLYRYPVPEDLADSKKIKKLAKRFNHTSEMPS